MLRSRSISKRIFDINESQNSESLDVSQHTSSSKKRSSCCQKIGNCLSKPSIGELPLSFISSQDRMAHYTCCSKFCAYLFCSLVLYILAIEGILIGQLSEVYPVSVPVVEDTDLKYYEAPKQTKYGMNLNFIKGHLENNTCDQIDDEFIMLTLFLSGS